VSHCALIATPVGTRDMEASLVEPRSKFGRDTQYLQETYANELEYLASEPTAAENYVEQNPCSIELGTGCEISLTSVCTVVSKSRTMNMTHR